MWTRLEIPMPLRLPFSSPSWKYFQNKLFCFLKILFPIYKKTLCSSSGKKSRKRTGAFGQLLTKKWAKGAYTMPELTYGICFRT